MKNAQKRQNRSVINVILCINLLSRNCLLKLPPSDGEKKPSEKDFTVCYKKCLFQPLHCTVAQWTLRFLKL